MRQKLNSKSRRDLKMNFNRTFSNVTLDATAHFTVKHFKSRLHKTVEMFLCSTSWCLQSIIAPLKRPHCRLCLQKYLSDRTVETQNNDIIPVNIQFNVQTKSFPAHSVFTMAPSSSDHMFPGPADLLSLLLLYVSRQLKKGKQSSVAYD